ncbi:MAG: LLM class flavin-dependent oxidoreductase [Sphingobacteriales bacterium]|nr:MAG: LLM class flavin-dependent oxidoreductase [Sphingobacteriales bacterium]
MTTKLQDIKYSVLDLATIKQGDASPADAFKRSLLFARHAEKLGYHRYWFAEHHNMESVASAATSVLIGYVAGGTETIRVGAGGVMLPNHAPLVIAEQFGTLEALYPGRIDLGLGRAPGTDPHTSHALRRNLKADVDDFPADVVELLGYLGPGNPQSRVRAIPGRDSNVPVWLLGSSTFSARLAALLGLPFAFASHFAPAQLFDALRLYRSEFRPSGFLSAPYAMACVNIIAAESDEVATSLSTSFQQLILGLFRNDRRPLPPPVDSMDDIWTEAERAGVMQMAHYAFIGSQETVRQKLIRFAEETGVQEIMTTTHLYHPEDKLRSMELTAALFT